MTEHTHSPGVQAADGQHHDSDHGDGHAHHICTWGLFAKIFAALLVLTVVTVAVSRFDFGSLNMFIAMAIAAVKASLVITVFMHVKWDTPINQIAFLSSLLFVALMFVFTLGDFATRGVADPLFERRAEVDLKPFQHVEGYQPPN